MEHSPEIKAALDFADATYNLSSEEYVKAAIAMRPYVEGTEYISQAALRILSKAINKN